MVISINEDISYTAAQSYYLGKFLCASGGTTACATNHPSCGSTIYAPAFCGDCKDPSVTLASGNASCYCANDPVSFGNMGDSSVSTYHESCGACSSKCGICEVANNPNTCYACNISYSTKSFVGAIGSWAVPSCHPSCATCTGLAANQCITCKATEAIGPETGLKDARKGKDATQELEINITPTRSSHQEAVTELNDDFVKVKRHTT